MIILYILEYNQQLHVPFLEALKPHENSTNHFLEKYTLKTLKSICGEQWMVQIHRTRSWRSTSAGK